MSLKGLVVFLAAFLVFPCQADQGKCVYYLGEIGAIKVNLSESPRNYSAARFVGGYSTTLLYLLDNLTEVDRKLCGDQLVPFDPTPLELQLYDFTPVAINLTSGDWGYVNDSYEFSCVLFQRDVIAFPFNTIYNSAYEDNTKSKFFIVLLTSIDTRASSELDVKEKDALRTELNSILMTTQEYQLKYYNSWVDGEGHLKVEVRVIAQIPLTVSTGGETISIFNDTFLMSVNDVGTCPAGSTVDADGTVTHWPPTVSSTFSVTRNATTNAITTRHCEFDFKTYQAEWDPRLSRWAIVWRQCESPDDRYTNEERFAQYLDPDIQLRHANELHNFTLTPVHTTTLQEIAAVVSRQVEARNELYEQTARDLVSITANLVMDTDYFVAVATNSYLIVTDLKGSYPPIGFTLEYNNDMEFTSQDEVTMNNKPTVQARAPFALDLSARLVEAHSRMAFVVLWKRPSLDFHYGATALYRATEYIEVTVMFPRQGEVSTWTFSSYCNHHVDITYDSVRMNDDSYSDYNFNLVACYAWNQDLQDWSSKGCTMLYSNKGNFSSCRCSAKYFVLQDGVPIAKYALKKGLVNNTMAMANNPLTEFLKDKIGLWSATVVECLLAAFSLVAIIGTAIKFKHWRENKGNKLLLHMVLALTCNLILGFTINFVRMATESVGCLIYGVLRHYSFLAMFFWMLVLSCLQLKRLTTMVGAKTTSHLILKVSAFAWGVPLLPITILLCWDPAFYQADRLDRGYCYPEGLVFHLTVQGPAGAILLVNLGIFVKIVLHIFECEGEEKIMRHSKVERAEQLNKLKTAFFIFFLFGFSWVFHILSEERVIVSDFLFEYLFLMTATTHISVLALFFVILQESTRKDWGKVLTKIFSMKHLIKA